jgi:UDP-N-acetylmuramoyl-tripeptide--D-alanyl-D-alanine ligase
MRIDLPEPDKFTKLAADMTGQQLDRQITGVTLDTREAKAGDLYIAIAGERVDGHDFLKQAAEADCAAAVVSKVDDTADLIQIRVDDPTATVSELAKEWRSSLSLEVTGITGSNGKTTTKDLLIHIFSAWHLVHGTRGNYNTHLGLPLTLLELDSQHSRSFLEMGANHRGDIGYLCSLSLPRHGLITNIAPSHLSSFGSIETIRETKGELFKSLPADGTAFVNADDENVRDLPTDAERVTYGFSHDCDFAGDMSRGDDGHITLIINGEEIETGSANQTFSMNLLAASAVASTLGMSWEVIQERVASFQAVTGRCRVEVKNGVTVIDDTYNANLTSTLAALDYLFDIPSEGERHFIFGDMLELGDASESHHQKVGVAASEKRVDHFYCYGAEAATASTAANGIDSRHFDGKKHLAEVIRENVSPGDVVLFKGSRGMALESVIEELFGD